MKNNCTSWLAHVLDEELGIQLNARMFHISALIRQILPSTWQRAFFAFWDSTYGQLPDLVQKMLYFFPPFYLLHVAVGLFYKLFTVGGYDGENDLELFDLFSVLGISMEIIL